ncbi:hypothetical protein [Methylopila sp. M107]|uniref:hypothetical protein n=1 Tax=Methylopila sp. M107 TaxID=1101190 RepID=UPI00036193D6|nr:hypothetical protein [Methylopila sp. M107]
MRATVFAFALLLIASPAGAQISGVQMNGPRPFGLILGDVFTLTTRLDVAPPFRLDASALPKPGPVTYWLDLRTLKISEEAGPNGVTRYRIDAEYQTFYAPMEAIEQTVPPFKLAATDGEGKRVEAEGGRWTFLTSPLRPIVGTAGGGSAYTLRPDAAPVRKSLRSAEIAVATAASAAALALLLVAWSRAWPPFHRRPSRPFAAAARTVAREARAGEHGWRAAALALHRAFDVAAGRRLLGDDLADFLAGRPAFKGLEPSIASFFAASRTAFFGAGRGFELPADDLLRLSRELAAAERSS